MSVEILAINVSPMVKFSCDSDKKGNRWNTVGNRAFRFRVTCKLRIDGEIVETYKETKHFEMDTDLASTWTFSFAEELLREMNADFSKLANSV